MHLYCACVVFFLVCLVWTWWYIITGNVPLMLAGWDRRGGSYGVAVVAFGLRRWFFFSDTGVRACVAGVYLLVNRDSNGLAIA